jgi:3D (Asp-Asp-Asp) domain-containing protein
MKTSRDRHGRKFDFGRLRWLALAAALCAVALGAGPAQAGTGGVNVTTSEGNAPTDEGIVFSSPMRSAGATWYGPGLYGNHTACGQTLRQGTIGVAHRTLPCGTTVKLAYHGHYLVTQVIDRGPYSKGNDFDLTNGARQALDFSGADDVHYAVAVQYARQR